MPPLLIHMNPSKPESDEPAHAPDAALRPNTATQSCRLTNRFIPNPKVAYFCEICDFKRASGWSDSR